MTGPHPLDADTAAADVFLRWHLGTDPSARVWRAGDAVAVVVPRGGEFGCLAVGDAEHIPEAVGEAATTLLAEGVDEVRLSLPPGVEAAGVERDPDASHWEWMWTARAADTAADGVGWLDRTDDADLHDLLAHSPRAHARPGDDGVRDWAGVRRDGLLVGAGALCAAPSGTPHLRAIVTHPDHRGAGHGAAVTSFLTAAGLREAPVVTLGMYADNDVARRVYHRLGFVTSHRWVSSRCSLTERSDRL